VEEDLSFLGGTLIGVVTDAPNFLECGVDHGPVQLIGGTVGLGVGGTGPVGRRHGVVRGSRYGASHDLLLEFYWLLFPGRRHRVHLLADVGGGVAVGA